MTAKHKLDPAEAAESEKPAKKPAKLATEVNPKRVRKLADGQYRSGDEAYVASEPGPGPVLYWCSRDKRVRDNWALLYAAQEAAKANVGLAVCVVLVPEFVYGNARQPSFMLRGLRTMEPKLAELNIPLFAIEDMQMLSHPITGNHVFQGTPEVVVPHLVERSRASLVVTDFYPMRDERAWRQAVAETADVPVHELSYCRQLSTVQDIRGTHGYNNVTACTKANSQVDAHNIIPCWEASEKQEYAARTIRTKIMKKLSQFLEEYPQLQPAAKWTGPKPDPINWDALVEKVKEAGKEVPEIRWAEPGEDGAIRALLGEKNGFLTTRLKRYAAERNLPHKPHSLSNLSPWLHAGQLAAARVVLEAKKYRKSHSAEIDSFLEELIVRRELTDNWCYYNEKYDQIEGAAGWAQETLRVHWNDKREFLYTKEQLETGKTYDELWNASQRELVIHGKMHGFMRMYWAKKILEWTENPQQALEIGLYLNDKYSIDGRDPNGVVGIMWSMCGVHDQGWKERPVFGKIRYMNENGCRRKFDVNAYIRYANALKPQQELLDPELYVK
eukprot:jgi/Chlat1/1994/Chrsp158S02315